ncbi:MAG: molybdenum ABC transporter ATP-binding protein [Gemmatimonadetes bacterium]|nr:molybdenum ABC transporter ATP-binding protein [Gemmatimonadota bacterium]
MTSRLDVEVATRRGDFELAAALSASGGTTVVFGPSGSGKTTLLRALAGLERAEGRITVDGEAWLDSAAGVDLPPHRRAVGYVFQHANLLPHLDVSGNLRYGARRASGSGPAWDEVIDWLGLGPLVERPVDGLSGGERQRVALGRALLRRPRLLLFDEPLSALDEPARRTMAPLLARVSSRFGMPLVLVTHSLDEAVQLGDRMVWLDEGRVRAAGPLADVVAGADFLRWRGDDAGVVVAAMVAEHVDSDWLTRLAGPWGDLWVRRQDRPVGSEVRMRILARDVSLALEHEAGSTLLNQISMRVTAVEESAAGQVLVRLVGDGGARTSEPPPAPLVARITTRSARRLELGPGRPVWARVKAVAVSS